MIVEVAFLDVAAVDVKLAKCPADSSVAAEQFAGVLKKQM